VKIAFIGGTLFIGHAAATAAIVRGHQVSVLHRGRHPCEVEGARSIPADRADPHDLIRALRKAAPDVVVDTRALTRPDAEVTALALSILGLPGVVLSSQDVYAQFGRLNGHPAPEPEPLVVEDAPLTIPFPFRGIAEHEGGEDYDKKEVERVLAEAVTRDVPAVVVLRLPAVYGPRDPKRRFGALVDALDRGERELPHQGGARFRWTHGEVRDVAHAIVLAAEQRRSGFRVYNVGETETPTMRQRAEAIAREMEAKIEWVERGELPPGFSELGTFPNDFVADTSRIRRELGFSEVTSAEQRISDLVRSLRSTALTRR
jgi:nucleoside-diphosphate-sugar epimerase